MISDSQKSHKLTNIFKVKNSYFQPNSVKNGNFNFSVPLHLILSCVTLASHAVFFRGLLLPPPHTSPLKTTAWEASVTCKPMYHQ